MFGKVSAEMKKYSRAAQREAGFTLVEVIIAGTIMIILSVGLLTVFEYAVRINRGENLRMQAMTVLQAEVEFYRSLKFVPVGSDAALNAGTFPNVRTRLSADNRDFNISVTIVNIPAVPGDPPPADSDAKFKEITIVAVPVVAETGWLANLRTNVTIQRVRSN